MESTTPGKYWCYLNKHSMLILIMYLLVCLRTEAAPRSNLFSTSGIHNSTSNDQQILDWINLLGGGGSNNNFNALALRSRLGNSIRTNSRDRDLLIYDQLWRAHIRDYSQTQSKIEVLGQVLKKHVAKLRQVPNGQVELVFLVDSSASVGLENFFNELKFVKKLLADFTVAMWATRVSVITFSSSHRVVANVDQISDPDSERHKCSLLNEELPRITYVGGGTYTKGALELAEAVLSHARPDATKAVFLVTDGYSNGGNPLPHALALRRSGVEVFTFGIRDGNVQELLSMSSQPQNEHCYIVDNFTEFEALARRALHEDLQVGDFLLERRDRCSSLCTEQSECCDVTATCRCGTHTGQYECVCPLACTGTDSQGVVNHVRQEHSNRKHFLEGSAHVIHVQTLTK
ncbi:sushi, von Willebrand factor type A, EGF and pentraxin domain-containing protein 1-like [Amphiura filiformis]|uniref:sushi, von Willebrand factor type A, EGF and pentraxin domain-containing protein 1-like n=1 Tax=Amphiura filiformis TaxID=82378 RepID=UPI003B217D9B